MNESGNASSVLDLVNEQRYPTPYSTSPLLPLLLLSLASQRHAPRTKSTFRKEYDYVIVGAGSAGSVLARRLSELLCVTILLLEAGKEPPRLTEIPANARSFITTDVDWAYHTAPQKHTASGLKNRSVPWPSGKALGGSSILNAMLYVRGNRRNYDEWAEMGATGWSYEEVLPYFKKLEDNTDPVFLENGFHSVGGPITASRPAYNSIKKVTTMQAIQNEGFEFVDPNAYEQVGFFDHQGSIRRGQRCSAAKAYLVPSENRTNLDILPNAMVRRVLMENNTAVGVEFDFRGSTRTVRARREVILSAGTINTAQLLILSGIGPMSELKKFNIPFVADLPVGLNLQDHPCTLLIYEVDKSIPKFENDIRDENNIRRYINNRTGPLTSTEGVFLMSFLSNNDLDHKIPDHTVYFVDFDNILPLQLGVSDDFRAEFFLPLRNQSVICCGLQLLHPKSRGSVTVRSSNPYDIPVIDPDYLEDFRDIHDMVQGMKTCHKIMNNPAMRRINARPTTTLVPGCEEFATDEELYFRCIVRTLIFTTNHQVGTAKMGDPRDPTTVVDPQLRVKGIRGLRVVDASVMPTIPWSNTNIPTIMVAEKASDIIKSTIQCNSDSCNSDSCNSDSCNSDTM